MKIIDDWQNDASLKGDRVVMTIGTFDGLHLGHQALIREVMKSAGEKKASSLLLTFEPHPLSVLSPNFAPETLTTFAQKSEILSAMGLDILACLRFTEAFSTISYKDFLEECLYPKADILEISIGPDFSFGRNAEGNLELLSSWAKEKGIAIRTLPIQMTQRGESLSSSHVRGLIKVGLVESASKLLGRPYKIEGTVISGAKRGRHLGFPTANLGTLEQLVPGPGVYAVKACLRGKILPGMTSIGNNPTFKNQYLTVETYIFDFSEEFYGERLGLEFISRIRNMIRFDGPESLVSQLIDDEKKARLVLGCTAKN
ncbi:MAG: riboflavin biosynthesis protein RibF [Deltaproteobacteria bacterium]|nr:riboflavin biosynthesis protein RibF [Deltaproteobacteria bacterium]